MQKEYVGTYLSIIWYVYQKLRPNGMSRTEDVLRGGAKGI